ncbi:MAG: HAMP domain-containing protein [Chlorobiaceae bacterium]|nr:HAMP domain-containing protein [Chlorobiaceae bacterium]
MKKEAGDPITAKGLFRKRLNSMSLRNRIALYYTGATAVLVALVFTAVYFLVDRVVYRQFDDELKAEITEIFTEARFPAEGFRTLSAFGSVDIDDKGEDDDDDEDRKKKTTASGESLQSRGDVEYIQIVDEKGRIFRKSLNLFSTALAFDLHHQDRYFFTAGLWGAPVRQVQHPLVSFENRTVGFLIIAVPMKNAIIVLHDLKKVFFLSFPVIILTLFVLSRAIAGRSIRPVEKVIATAEQMTQSNLDRRIVMPPNRDELYRLSATINSFLDRIQEAFLREKQFTADASHELKTPLAAIKGTLEVLKRKPREREYYESKIQYCLGEVNRMTVLIDQLLMLARHESSSVTSSIETIVLASHAADAVERIRHVADEKQITFDLDLDETLRVAADPAMLGIILENLLSNAVKFSPAGSSVSLTVKRNEALATCTIRDNGIGIPADRLQNVFERFYRVDQSRNSGTGGSGLGLAIVRKLADLQKIRVAITSAKNEGTAVTLIFPGVQQ